MKSGLVLLAAVASVSAHSTWQDLWVGSTDKGTSCARTVKDNSPIASITNSDMFCGRGPASSSGVCEVAGMSYSHPKLYNNFANIFHSRQCPHR
jgi:cellulase